MDEGRSRTDWSFYLITRGIPTAASRPTSTYLWPEPANAETATIWHLSFSRWPIPTAIFATFDYWTKLSHLLFSLRIDFVTRQVDSLKDFPRNYRAGRIRTCICLKRVLRGFPMIAPGL